MSLKQQLQSTASLVDDFILSMLDGRPKGLYLAASHYIGSGGKRLRPFLLIKSCELLGGNAKQALPVAAALEMVHNFTLMHDDIMDNDAVRHGVQTAHRQFGLPLAILGGDVLFMKAFQSISSHGLRAGLPEGAVVQMIERLTRSCLDLSEGQALDVGMASSARFPSDTQYINMITKKTAVLFQTACELGAICAGAGRHDVSNLAAFGRNLGIAFQLVDDLIGSAGDSKITKKPVGNDIREGKKTLPILLAIKKVNQKDKDKILQVFGSKRCSDQELRDAVGVIVRAGVDREVRRMAGFYAAKAVNSIKRYKNSRAKHAIMSLADFVVERTL